MLPLASEKGELRSEQHATPVVRCVRRNPRLLAWQHPVAAERRNVGQIRILRWWSPRQIPKNHDDHHASDVADPIVPATEDSPGRESSRCTCSIPRARFWKRESMTLELALQLPDARSRVED